MILTIIDSVKEWGTNAGESIKQFFVEYGSNPFLWVGIIFLGLVVFELTYQALSRNKG